jgi:6-phosphofructokinase 1
MPSKSNAPHGTIGILTAGGDCPGLNAVIRGVAKAAMHYGISVIGIKDGFRGLVEGRTMPLDNQHVSGILTQGGTFLGSSRDKPHKMKVGSKVVDQTDLAVRNYRKLKLDCLVCLGGNGTQKSAFRLHQKGGINVLTLPKTIDNDVAETDITFGFDSAMAIATEAIDRLHTTATSHQRIIVCEIMGHDAGWLCLGSGIAGGADVILIPEIPYELEAVARHLLRRQRAGKRFSLIAVAEGIVSREEARARDFSRSHHRPARAGGGREPARATVAAAHGRRGARDVARPRAARRTADGVRPAAVHAIGHEGRRTARAAPLQHHGRAQGHRMRADPAEKSRRHQAHRAAESPVDHHGAAGGNVHG